MVSHRYPGSIDRRSFCVMGGSALLSLTPLAPMPASAAASEVVVGKDGWLFPAFDQVSRVDYTRVQQGAAFINDVVGVLKQAKIQTVICLTPAKSRILSEHLPDGVKFTPDTQRRYGVELEALRRNGTPVPDLLAAMSALRKAEPGTPLFFKADTHWTPQGAACAANAVADTIKAGSLLPPSSKPGPRLGPPRDMMQSKNDLALLLPSEERAKYPLQSYKLPQAVETGGGDLLAEEGADTVLVGNSYLHPSFGFSTALANRLNRPVWLVWKIHSFSPYWNLIDYLGSSAFAAQRPKVVVWVFHETDLTIPPNNSAIWGQTAMKPDAILTDLRKRVGA